MEHLAIHSIEFDSTSLYSPEAATRQAAQKELVAAIKAAGPVSVGTIRVVPKLLASLGDKKDAAARQYAAELIGVLITSEISQIIEPFILSSSELLNIMFETYGDKTPAVKDAISVSFLQFIEKLSTWATATVLPVILHQISTNGKWQVKIGGLSLLDKLVTCVPDQLARLMPEIIPVLSVIIHDTKADVKKASRTTLSNVCQLVNNKDIDRFIPALQTCLINPIEETQKTIQLLGATTFVSEVDSPTLALMVPLLSRGLAERPTATRRKTALIIDNMSKLVDNEFTVRPFVPKLLPGLLKIEQTVSDPEARGVITKAIKTLRSVAKLDESSDGTDLPPAKTADKKSLLSAIVAASKKAGHETEAEDSIVQYVASLAVALSDARNYEHTEWESALVPHVSLLVSPSNPESAKHIAIAIVKETLDASAVITGTAVQVFDDEEEGEDLCNCTFSLAYGAKILLNRATLRLKRGHRYGLCGRNGSGKSTLMTAIVRGQVEGFPDQSQVRTFYCAHDIDGSESELSVIDWVAADDRIQGTLEEKKTILGSVGFSEERQEQTLGALSGGWKMKLALARAILFKADILLLDEPTNHLDVLNVQWLIDYLTSLTHCTSIIVSHDSGFLNKTATDILHLNRFKVKRYPGNLEAFVKFVPEAKAYYELTPADEYQFKIPNPPLLDGVKTKEKSLLKMRKCGFQYPSTKVPQLIDISLQVSLSSRVAVLGPNGAGKSTLVKLLVGDSEPNLGGEVWKHPALVVGYVAQHAFHHIDQHLDKTPLEYMLWRYQTGEDLEEMLKANKRLTPEEEETMKQGSVMVIEGVKRLINEILARKKLKQSYEYEVSFKNMSSSENIWIPRDELIKRGFEKKVMELDTREAQRLGMMRPLVRKEVEKHFEDFGLEAEFVTHNTMIGLSGGQKVKVVLGAATWRRPHVIILDEPTNYLDRESLAALIKALKDFEGGVLVITHSREFSESICTEVWAMHDGHLTASGHNWVEGQGSGARIDTKKDEEEEKFDAMGNKILSEAKQKKQSAADARKAKKDRMARRKRGEEVESDMDL